MAALILHANRSVATDTLVDLVWGDRPPVAVSASIHTYVAMLRRALDPDRRARGKPSVLLTSPPGYELRVDADTVDAQRFPLLTASVRRQLGEGGPLVVPAELTASELDGSADQLATRWPGGVAARTRTWTTGPPWPPNAPGCRTCD